MRSLAAGSHPRVVWGMGKEVPWTGVGLQFDVPMSPCTGWDPPWVSPPCIPCRGTF